MANLSVGDSNHAIVRSFDESTNSLTTNLQGITSTNNGGKVSLDVNVSGITINGADDSIKVVGANTNSIEPNANGSINVQAVTMEDLLNTLTSQNEMIQYLLETLVSNTCVVDNQKRARSTIEAMGTTLQTALQTPIAYGTGNIGHIPYNTIAPYIYQNIVTS